MPTQALYNKTWAFGMIFLLKGFCCGEEEEQRKESKSKAGRENEREP